MGGSVEEERGGERGDGRGSKGGEGGGEGEGGRLLGSLGAPLGRDNRDDERDCEPGACRPRFKNELAQNNRWHGHERVEQLLVSR